LLGKMGGKGKFKVRVRIKDRTLKFEGCGTPS
jgi:hypothetical protein